MNQQDNENLVHALVAENVEPATAMRLAQEVPDICRRQLSYLDYQDDVDDRAATLVASIEGDWPEPARSYWANDVQRAATEKATAEKESQGETESGTATRTASESSKAESAVATELGEADEDVRNLLAALESIAVMSHAHRDDGSTPCPVCVAWDALKQWAHHKSLHG